MADLLVLEFSSTEARELYNQVGDLLGTDGTTGRGDWPSGLLTHVVGLDGSSLIVVEVWEDRATQEKFMSERLGPALGQAGVPEPKRVQWFNLIGEMRERSTQ